MATKTIWRKFRLYKRFELDIWGFYTMRPNKNNKISKLFNAWHLEKSQYLRNKRLRYIYRIDLDKPARVRKRHKWRFLSRKLTKLFYMTLTKRQSRKLARVASRKEGSWESNFIMLIEGRIISVLYRMQFLLNVFELRFFIRGGNVLVNNKLLTYHNAAITYADIVRLKKWTSHNIRYALIKRLRDMSFFFNIPRYMIISYKLMFGFIYQEPKRRDLSYPIAAVDIYRCADVY